jgi:hypothetical protein
MATYQVRLLLPQGEARFPCESNTFVLHAALAHGLDLPYTLLAGLVHHLRWRLLKGELDQSASARFYPVDARAGFCLPCTARPRSDVTIRTHQKAALREHRLALGLPTPRG